MADVTYLTPLQFRIAAMWAARVPHAEIQRRTGSSKAVVATLLYRVRKRLGVCSTYGMAVALLECDVRDWDGGGRPARSGLHLGDPVRITGGRFHGRTGIYCGVKNSTVSYVKVGGGSFGLAAKYVEPIREVA
jgi:DNA-binding CsgD family transcriptional regulator